MSIFGRVIASIRGSAPSGVFGTVIVGWDWQIGPKGVFGLFADFDFHDNNNDSLGCSTDLSGHSIDHDIVRGRSVRWLGVLSSPSTLWYITGGYTQVELGSSRARRFDEKTSRSLVTGPSSGWFVGAGVDTRLGASNWFLQARVPVHGIRHWNAPRSG